MNLLDVRRVGPPVEDEIGDDGRCRLPASQVLAMGVGRHVALTMRNTALGFHYRKYKLSRRRAAQAALEHEIGGGGRGRSPARRVWTLIVCRHVALAMGNTALGFHYRKYKLPRRRAAQAALEHEIGGGGPRPFAGPTSAHASSWQAHSLGGDKQAPGSSRL